MGVVITRILTRLLRLDGVSGSDLARAPFVGGEER